MQKKCPETVIARWCCFTCFQCEACYNEQRQEIEYESKEVKSPWIHWPTAEECMKTVEKETDSIKELT